jgi:arsenate reductase
MKIYTYKKCGSCQKAIKWLKDHNCNYEEFSIRDQIPKISELEQMLFSYDGEIKKLFNTSGKDYREMDYKNKITSKTNEQLLDDLSKNGNLIKRPFVLSKNCNLVGFSAKIWEIKFQLS